MRNPLRNGQWNRLRRNLWYGKGFTVFRCLAVELDQAWAALVERTLELAETREGLAEQKSIMAVSREAAKVVEAATDEADGHAKGAEAELARLRERGLLARILKPGITASDDLVSGRKNQG
jgi:hypothetical protein